MYIRLSERCTFVYQSFNTTRYFLHRGCAFFTFSTHSVDSGHVLLNNEFLMVIKQTCLNRSFDAFIVAVSVLFKNENIGSIESLRLFTESKWVCLWGISIVSFDLPQRVPKNLLLFGSHWVMGEILSIND